MPESQLGLSLVVVCCTLSWFVQRTVVPAVTVTVSGLNALSCIGTSTVDVAGVGAWRGARTGGAGLGASGAGVGGVGLGASGAGADGAGLGASGAGGAGAGFGASV